MSNEQARPTDNLRILRKTTGARELQQEYEILQYLEFNAYGGFSRYVEQPVVVRTEWRTVPIVDEQ